MTYGYASDVPNDETVMEYPVAQLTFDTAQLTREQALTLAKIGDVENEHGYDIAVSDPREDHGRMGSVAFHLPFESAVQMLIAVGILDQPTLKRQ